MGTMLPWQSIQTADFNKKKKKKKKIQIFNPLDQGYCRWNLGQIGLVASEDMSFESSDAKQHVTYDRQRRKTAYPISPPPPAPQPPPPPPPHPHPPTPGTFGSGELNNNNKKKNKKKKEKKNINYKSPSPRTLKMKFGSNQGTGFRDVIWKCWRQTTADDCLSYKSPWARLWWAEKKQQQKNKKKKTKTKKKKQKKNTKPESADMVYISRLVSAL